METSYRIRPAVEDDVEAVHGFICHLEEQVFDQSRFTEKFLTKLKKPDIIYLVAEQAEDNVIGFLSSHGQHLLHHEHPVYEIQELYVARPWRDQGIGKALIQALEEELKKIPCECLEVSTNIKRTEAKKFYGKSGFVQTHIKFIKIR